MGLACRVVHSTDLPNQAGLRISSQMLEGHMLPLLACPVLLLVSAAAAVAPLPMPSCVQTVTGWHAGGPATWRLACFTSRQHWCLGATCLAHPSSDCPLSLLPAWRWCWCTHEFMGATPFVCILYMRLGEGELPRQQHSVR